MLVFDSRGSTQQQKQIDSPLKSPLSISSNEAIRSQHFLNFAAAINAGFNDARQSGVCRNIWTHWLGKFLNSLTTSQTAPSFRPVKDSSGQLGQDTRPLFEIIYRPNDINKDPYDKIWMLVGIYHFVVRYCTVIAGNSNFRKALTGYLVDKVNAQNLGYTLAVDPITFATTFESLNISRNDWRKLFKSKVNPAEKTNDCADETRRLISEMVLEETKIVFALIEKANFEILETKIASIQVVALGDGGATKAFFGQSTPSTGLTLFDYSKSDPKAANRTDPKKLNEIDGSTASSIFIAHIGVDNDYGKGKGPGLMANVQDSQNTISDKLYIEKANTCNFTSYSAKNIYDSETSCIEIPHGYTAKLDFFTVNVPGETDLEELGFLVIASNIDGRKSIKAYAKWNFDSNVYYKRSEQWKIIRAEIKSIAEAMAEASDLLEIKTILRGFGIGQIVASDEVDANALNVRQASSQNDKEEKSQTDAEKKRYAHCTLDFRQGVLGPELNLEIKAFASTGPCNWNSMPDMQGTGTTAPINQMNSLIGDNVTDRTKMPNKPEKIWYNGTLSSLRTFGLLLATVDLLKAEIQSVVGITQPKLNELNGKLDACITTATVLIPQKRPDKSVQKGGADLKIDKAIFDAVTPADWLNP